MDSNKINKLGFTMIELLGAIVIMGILATIGIVSVTKVLNSSHDKFNQSQGKILNQAGQNYFSDNKKNLPTVVGEKKIIYLEDLVNNNYIDKIYGYDKKPFNLESSFVTVTKLKNGKYKYEYRLCYDEEGKQCVGNGNNVINKTNNSKIEFIKYDKFNTKDDNTFYTNNYVEITVGITDNVKKIIGYKYEIQKNNNQVKTSEIINVNETNYLENVITLSKNDYKDGQYKIIVTSYDTDGAAKSVTSDKKIFIDTVSPTCEVILSGTQGTNGWWKEKDVDVFIKKSDNNNGSGIYSFDLSTGNSLYENISEHKKQGNTSGVTWNCHVKDKAGNIGTNSINFKVDKTAPSCDVSGGSSSWINAKSSTSFRKIIAKCNDTNRGPSGCSQSSSGEISMTYSNDISTTTAGAAGNNNGGVVYDNAGNSANCPANQIVKIDKTAPTCTSSGGSDDWFNHSVKLTGICSDGMSGCTGNVINVISDEVNQFFSPGYVSDIAGNSVDCPKNQKVKIDLTPPVCDMRVESKEQNFNTQNVNIKYSQLTDNNGSGIKSYMYTDSNGKTDNIKKTQWGFTDSYDGQNYWIHLSIKDNAGNSGDCGSQIYSVYKLCSDIKNNSEKKAIKWENSSCTVDGITIPDDSGLLKGLDATTKTNLQNSLKNKPVRIYDTQIIGCTCSVDKHLGDLCGYTPRDATNDNHESHHQHIFYQNNDNGKKSCLGQLSAGGNTVFNRYVYHICTSGYIGDATIFHGYLFYNGSADGTGFSGYNSFTSGNGGGFWTYNFSSTGRDRDSASSIGDNGNGNAICKKVCNM